MGKTRRILDVNVHEVSLVDRAANLRQFLVIKRLEEDEMPAFINEERRKSMTEEEKRKAEEEEKRKAAEEEEKRKAEEEEKRKAEEEEKRKGMNPVAIAGLIRGIKGAPKDAVDKLVAYLETQKQEDKYPYPSPTSKSLDNVSVAVMQDGSVIVSGQPVTKAKQFTENRTNTVKEVVTQLLGLLNDVDEKSLKAVEESLKEMQNGVSPSSEVRPIGTQKALQDELAKRDELIKSLSDRLEQIEKAKPASKSIEDGGTDSKTVKKSLWDGVL